MYESPPAVNVRPVDQCSDFNDPQGSLKGIIAAAYGLGAILSLPFVPIVNEKFGRRWAIMGGSIIMCIGAIIQGFAQNGESLVS